MQDNAKTKIKEAFKTGNASIIASTLLAYYQEQNFYRKPAFTKSLLPSVLAEDEDNIIKAANEIFNIQPQGNP